MIASIDGANRLIYLDASTVNQKIHPMDIYKEMRTMRELDTNLRKYRIFLKAYGNVPTGSGSATERYVQTVNGTTIVPYNVTHALTITGIIITDDGNKGVYCFNRSLLSPTITVDINYEPPQVEVITITTGGSALTLEEHNKLMGLSDAPTAQEIWEYATRVLTSAGAGGATAQEVWEYATRELTAIPSQNMDEDDLHSALDSYANKDGYKATETAVDLSGIPQAVWEYATRTLTSSLGLTPEQEAKLDIVRIDIAGISTKEEIVTALLDTDASCP